jgi:Na+-transporting NADH:ubiquinone oxidoreductase subunit NqrF
MRISVPSTDRKWDKQGNKQHQTCLRWNFLAFSDAPDDVEHNFCGILTMKKVPVTFE